MAEFLLEILSEEIPARMQARAADDLKRLVCDGLKAAGLEFTSADAYVTPRRLTLVVDGLPEKQPDVREERKGPQVGAPDKAIEGFLGSVGLTLDQCEKRDIKGKEFWFAVIERKGRATAEVLAELIVDVLVKLPWPKSMRWGTTDFQWVRPIRSILAVFNGDYLDGGFRIATHSQKIASELPPAEWPEEIAFSNVTVGHPFMAPDAITVTGFDDYRDRLRQAYVMLDPAERADTIKADAETLVTEEGLRLRDDPGLLAEVAGLVEWPVALIGAIDDQFMDLPAPVLTESMRAHQKYFAVERPDGTLAPRFVVIANTLTDDGGAAIVAGNERVLRARLSDARFFWDTDRKQTLENRTPKLEQIVFHARLGTVAEKVDRMEGLAAELTEYIPGADRDKTRSAAHLAKADLVTGMVGEFPELQGVMGRYYALADGEHADIAEAIAEHYAPRGPGEACPTAPTSIAVALADKVDSLVGFFAIGETPTGSRDPFALRRAALGVIRLIVENDLRVALADVFAKAHQPMAQREGNDFDPGELLAFFADRLKVQMREQGVRHDLIAAVFATPKPGGGQEDDLTRLLARVDALGGFLATEDGANLLTAYKRAVNIVAIEEKKDKRAYAGTVDTSLLEATEEKSLNKVLAAAEKGLGVAIGGEDFTAAMTVLSELRQPIDAFFDQVTVNTDDPGLRENRLHLLARIRTAMNLVADFSEIEG